MTAISAIIAPGAVAQSPHQTSNQSRPPTPAVRVRSFDPVEVVYIAQRGPGWGLGKIFSRIDTYMIEFDQPGPTFVRYLDDPSASPQDRPVEVGFFIRGYLPHNARFKRKTLPRYDAATMTVESSYATASLYHQMLFDWAANNGYRALGEVIEVYPSRSPQQPVIEIRLPVKRSSFARRTPPTTPSSETIRPQSYDPTPYGSDSQAHWRSSDASPYEWPPPEKPRPMIGRRGEVTHKPDRRIADTVTRNTRRDASATAPRDAWTSRRRERTAKSTPRSESFQRRTRVIPPPSTQPRLPHRATRTTPVVKPPAASFDSHSLTIDDAEWFNRIADRLKVIRDVVKMKYGPGAGGVEAMVTPILLRAADAAKTARRRRTIGGSGGGRDVIRRKTDLLREFDRVMVSAHIRELTADQVRSELVTLLIKARDIGTVSTKRARLPTRGRVIGGG